MIAVVVAAAACEEIEREPSIRYYIPPDAGADVTRPIPDAAVADADADADVPLDASDDADAASSYDPGELSLSGWWRAPTAATWVGEKSAGTSATRNLAEATNPPAAGAAVNGFVPADFDGTNDVLANPSPLASLVNASSWSCVLLVNLDAVSTANSSGALEMLSDSRGYWTLGSWNNPTPRAVIGQFDGAQRTVETAMNLGEWSLVQAKFDGAMLRLRVNSGAWATAASNNIQVTTGTLNVGKNYTSTLFFNGKMLELMLSTTAFPDATFDDIKAYVNARYALAL